MKHVLAAIAVDITGQLYGVGMVETLVTCMGSLMFTNIIKFGCWSQSPWHAA